MKKLFLVLMTVSLVALFVVPAMASSRCDDGCNVDVNVDVYKRASFCERTSMDTHLFLGVRACLDPKNWASASISECQTNAGQHFTAKGDPGKPAQNEKWSGSFSGTGTYKGKVGGYVSGVVIDDPKYRHGCPDIDPFVGEFCGSESGTLAVAGKVEGSYTVAAIDPKYVTLSDGISKSFGGFEGIAQVNQAAGSGNNQGNAVAAAVVDPSTTNGNNTRSVGNNYHKDDPAGLAKSQVEIGQVNYRNCVSVSTAIFTDSIVSSFNDFQGVAQVNQAAGFANNQKNDMALAANVKSAGVVAMSDAFMTQKNTGNRGEFCGSVNLSSGISESFNKGFGVAQVNQSPGSMNNQANTVAISYSGYK